MQSPVMNPETYPEAFTTWPRGGCPRLVRMFDSHVLSRMSAHDVNGWSH